MAFLAGGGFQCPAEVDPLVGSHHRCRPASRLVSSARVGGPAQRLRVLIGKINSFFFDSKSFLFVVKLTCYTKHFCETNVLSKTKSIPFQEELAIITQIAGGVTVCVDARVDPIGTVCPTRLALSTTERFSFFRDRALLATEHQVLSLDRVDQAPQVTVLLDSPRGQLFLLDTPV